MTSYSKKNLTLLGSVSNLSVAKPMAGPKLKMSSGRCSSMGNFVACAKIERNCNGTFSKNIAHLYCMSNYNMKKSFNTSLSSNKFL